jgi:TonB family protein
MEALGLVLLKSAAWLTGFALVYMLVLRNERYFRLNRLYLLTGITASLLFPFYTFHYTVVIPFIQTGSAVVDELIPVGVVSEEPTLPVYFWIYLTGFMVVLLRLLFQTWKIIRKLKESGYEQTGSVKLVRTSEYASSFSFFSFVFVNPSTSASEMEVIMNHEREHIQQRHWLDLLMVELICIVQWFNPFAWIYVHLVRQNHEYLADEQALQRTVDPVIYQAALLNQLLGAPVFSLTNSFSYSLNKKRFNMMKKKIESPFRKMKILAVLPLVAMLFYAFAAPEYQYGNEYNSVAPEGKTMDVKGQVLKSDGTTPLPGTSVILRGSTLGTITDKDGNFLLKGIPADGELVFSFVGFQSKVQRVNDKPMKIVMEVGKVGIEQVTVVGYGTPPPPQYGNKNSSVAPDGKTMDVKGQVLKSDGNPLHGTSVILRGSTMGTITDQDGNFLLKGIPAEGELVFSFVGFKTVVQKVSNQPMKIVMEVSKVGIDQVTVIGYGTPPPPPPPPAMSLRGIDDANPPLFFLDGIPITKAAMDKLDPETFESISVLKNKSGTSLYGEQGKNGVILIKTKAKTDYSAGTGIDYSAPKEKQVFVVVEEMPEFPGGDKALKDYIHSHVKYPEDAKNEGIQGRVFVNFVVKSDGTIGGAKVVRGAHPLLDKEALRVVSLFPTWKPGRQRGQAVNVAYTIPVQFFLEGDKSAKMDLWPPSPKVPLQRPDGVFVVVEEMPEFPGGELALRSFIGSNVKYPADAIKDSIQGKVFVTFVVKSDGTVGDAKIARGVHPLLDSEAIRVINSLPAWTPGKQGGEAVSVSYTVPVQFVLQNGTVKQTVSFVSPKDMQKAEKQVFVVVEEMPEFPGGSLALRTFIAKAIIYPTEAQKDKIQGKVFVSFVVNSTGKVENAKIERSVSPAIDAEAIRVVNLMPDWKPGKQRGTAVSVEYTIPIEFKLQ